MSLVSKWAIGIGLVSIGAVALAADTAPAPQAKPAQQAPDSAAPATPAATPARRPRLTTPWSQLTDLSDDQKTKILAIIGKTNDDIAAIRKKERADIMVLLTDDQKKKAEEVDASRTLSRRGRGASTRPAGQ